jgi:site-specific recombinase XerD
VPKGLRHGYAINALNKGVQLNLVSKWMGHSAMETTAIYANAVGEEQQAIAARMWS